MTKGLALADDLTLPLDAATRRMAILAMSGAGKSNLAVVLAEQMHAAGIPWVAIDPKGDWWGIRSSSDGGAGGLPIPIFGGLHGDVPLEPRAGKLIADLIVDQRLTCVLDVSEFDNRQAMWGFLIDLGEELLRRNRDALHVFVEEADELLPQKASERGHLPRCLGVWQRLVKRGRFRGIGTTQITQRSASLNKDTLYQAEALFALRVTGAGDRKAIAGWVEYHQGAREIVDSLPTLRDGEGWLVSPAWLKDTRRVRFDRRATFDSGATPVSLRSGRKPATLADIDLPVLRERMSEALERAKADDPTELRAKLAAAERKIRELEARPAPQPTMERVEVPVLDLGTASGLDAVVSNLRNVSADIERQLAEARALAAKAAGAPQVSRGTVDRQVVQERRKPAGGAGRAVGPARPLANGHDAGAKLPSGERAILTATAQYPEGATREQLIILTGYKRSTRDAYLQRLGEKGYVAAGVGVMIATAEGVAALGPDYEPLPTGDALRAYWLARLPEGEGKVLSLVADHSPGGVTREVISEQTNFARSTRDAYIQRLQARRLVSSSGGRVFASAELFS